MSKAFTPQLKILLLRHGQAVSNKNAAFLGRRDDPLTQLGQEQVSQLASRLDVNSIDAIYTSPLQRARHTAEAIAKKADLPLFQEALLIEQDFGDWDGVPVKEVFDENPEILRQWRENGPETRPPGGESLLEVAARMDQFFQSTISKHSHPATLAFVGHGGAFQALLCKIFQVPLRPMWPFKLALGSISEVHITANQPSLIRLSA